MSNLVSKQPVNVQPQLVDQLRFLLKEAEAGRIHQGVFIAHGIEEGWLHRHTVFESHTTAFIGELHVFAQSFGNAVIQGRIDEEKSPILRPGVRLDG